MYDSSEPVRVEEKIRLKFETPKGKRFVSKCRDLLYQSNCGTSPQINRKKTVLFLDHLQPCRRNGQRDTWRLKIREGRKRGKRAFEAHT